MTGHKFGGFGPIRSLLKGGFVDSPQCRVEQSGFHSGNVMCVRTRQQECIMGWPHVRDARDFSKEAQYEEKSINVSLGVSVK